MTFTDTDERIGETRALFPSNDLTHPPDLKRPGHHRRPTQPAQKPPLIRHGQVCEWRGREHMVLGGNREKTLAQVARLPIRRDTVVDWVDADTLKGEAVRTGVSSADDAVITDALLDLSYLSRAQMRILGRDIDRHPDAHLLDNRPLPDGHLCIRCATPTVLRSIVRHYKTVRIVGMDYLMPEAMIDTLSHQARQLRLDTPSVAIGIAIANGHRLSLHDCYRCHLWVEARWDGGVVVLPMESEAGERIYEVLGSRQSKCPARERDWICDCDTLAEAVDTAGLLKASFEGIHRAIVATGQTPPSAIQK